MLLIRPWIALNRDRFAQFHLAFFIFIVSNIGGVLLPIGPPLLLGYLKGVPFWWVAQRCWLPWSIILGAVLICFYFVDRLTYRAAPVDVAPEYEDCRRISRDTGVDLREVMRVVAEAARRELGLD